MKPKVTAKVRALLVELEPVCRQFDAQSASLSNPETEFTAAVDIGADREATRRLLASLAYRINKAWRGDKE